MTNSSRNFVKIIKEICEENKISISSFGYDWVFELQKNNKTIYIVGYEFPDVSSSKKICDDKSSLSEILTKHNIPNIEHIYFMNPKDIFYIGETNQKDRLIQTFNNFNQNIVIKQNSGTSGINVFHISDSKKILPCINKIFKNSMHVAIAPFVNIEHEYRVIIYKNKPLLIFEKKRKSSWKHNLAHGAIPVILNNKSLASNLSKLATSASSLLGIRFASIDIVSVDNKLLILEINSGVMLEKFSSFSVKNYKITRSIYRKVILDNFR